MTMQAGLGAPLDPNLAEAHAALALVQRAYDWDWVGADASSQRALQLDPGNPSVILDRARVTSTLGRLDEALDLARRAATADPLNARAHYPLARYAYFPRPSRRGVVVVPEAYRGEVDRAFEWLERAYAQRDSGLSQIKGHPHLKSLESDPRYAAFLEKMRLPP